MKEQKLREFISKFIKEMINEASRSTVKKGSEEKYQDKYGRNVTKMTMISKKGRETDMIQHDGDSQIKEDFDWNSLRGLQDYHYDEKATDIYTYNDVIIVNYRKENKQYSFPPVLFNRPKKMENNQYVIESTYQRDGVDNPEKGNFEETTELILIPKNKWLLIKSKWENRDSSKSTDLNKTGRVRTKGSAIGKGKDKALFKGGSDKEGYFDIGGTLKKAAGAKRGSQFSG